MNAGQWQDMLKDGGMSAPAWAFFSAITLALIALLREMIMARKKLSKVEDKTEQAVSNTQRVGNGFVARQDSNFATLFELVSRIDGKFDKLDTKVNDHIEQTERILSLNPDIVTKEEK